jgi:hypothetical protein
MKKFSLKVSGPLFVLSCSLLTFTLPFFSASSVPSVVNSDFLFSKFDSASLPSVLSVTLWQSRFSSPAALKLLMIARKNPKVLLVA